MRPSKLIFNGINSFSERQTIDFDKLTANGLFGIFGETGSGKSTILDCINFALYGNVDRSKKKTDIINYNCEQAEVEFEFTILSDGVRKHCRVERSIKKKSGLGKAMLYVGDGKQDICIADNTTSVNAAVENLIGLNAEDFRKCIALPQGEFAQFVKCAPAERFKIIERLFSLYRYGEGLRERLAKREAEVNEQYLTASGELSAYCDVTEEAVKESKTKLTSAAKDLAELEEKGKIVKSEAEKLNNIFKQKKELDAAENDLAIALGKSGEIKELRNIVKVAPKCKSVVELNVQLANDKNVLSAEIEQEKARKDNFDRCFSEYTELEKAYEAADYENTIAELKGKLVAFEAAKADIEDLSATDKSLRALRDKYRAAMLKYEKSKEDEQNADLAVKQAKALLEACTVQDLGDILEDKLKPAILRGEYTDTMVYFGDLRESIKGYDDNSELYKFLREELTDRIKYYEQKILAVQSDKVNVNAVIADFKKQADLREKLQNEYNKKNEKLAECKQKRLVTESELNALKREGGELNARNQRLREKLDNLFGKGDGDYANATRRLKFQCDETSALRDKTVSQIEIKKKTLDELTVQSEKSKAKISSLDENINFLEIRLKGELKDSGLNSLEECTEILRVLGEHKNAEDELVEYEVRVSALKKKISELSNVPQIKYVDEAMVLEANNRLAEWEKAVKESHAAAALAENTFKNLSERLVKKSENEKALEVISNRRELVLQLKELTRGNKFLEYIAGEYLSDISKAASVTLLKLTGGRYYLTYEDNFYVGDNYNEGKMRGVNTLSGGETFLVSLSLALALSSAICHGSLKSIEFFFLDEGFGTLDESLVDTVMDSLEKLRSAEFTIGIISHVEELKHRIESKIIVNKATETHGSSVSVSC